MFLKVYTNQQILKQLYILFHHFQIIVTLRHCIEICQFLFVRQDICIHYTTKFTWGAWRYFPEIDSSCPVIGKMKNQNQADFIKMSLQKNHFKSQAETFRDRLLTPTKASGKFELVLFLEKFASKMFNFWVVLVFSKNLEKSWFLKNEISETS